MFNRADQHPEEGLQVAHDQGLVPVTNHYGEKVLVPRQEANDPERDYGVHPSDHKSYNSPPGYSAVNSHGADPNGANGARGSQRVCGLKKKTFIIAVIIAFVVIAAVAIGAGVGATRKNSNSTSSKSSSDSDSQNASIASQSPATTSPNSQSSITATPTASETSDSMGSTILDSPTQTLIRDCPSSDNTEYSLELDGNTLNYHKLCNADVGFDSFKHISILQRTNSLDDCINLCSDPPLNEAGTALDPCNAVCWRNSEFAGVRTGTCYGFVVEGATNANGFMANTAASYCDSAVYTGNGTRDG